MKMCMGGAHSNAHLRAHRVERIKADVVHAHGDGRVGVVGVHVAHHGRREGLRGCVGWVMSRA